MDKIYSRKKIKLPQIKGFFSSSNIPNKGDKNKKKLVQIIIVLIIAFTVVATIVKAVTPIFEEQCIAKAKNIATIVSNEQATNVMKEYSYQDLVTISKDNNGNVTMIKANVIPINEIISDIPVKIQNELDKSENSSFNLKLGSLTGSKWLSGFGPDIKIKLASTGDVETDLRSEFTSVGINQTLHRMYLQVSCTVIILTPYQTFESTILNQVLLAEAVIVGKIPEAYYNLEGMGKDNAVDIIQ